MSTSRKILNAVDLKSHPAIVADEVIRDGISAEHNWLLYFFRDFINGMANLEQSQGGYRGEDEILLSNYCKWMQGIINEAEAFQNRYEGKHANN